MHKYLIFHIEVSAYLNWRRKIEKDSGWTMPFDNNWRPFYTDTYPKPTKEEKILYLYKVHSLGMNKIAKALNASPNFVLKTIKEERRPRQYKEDQQENLSLQHWQTFRKHLPNEIFIKYL